MLIGYARVSKADGSQSLDLQQDGALRAEGVEAINLYHDLASGVRDDRPGLDSCLARATEGRRARRLEARPSRPATSPTWSTPYRTCRPAAWACGCSPARARTQIDTTTAAGRLVFGIFAALAEFERELIRERTQAGLQGRASTWPQGRQDVRAVESPGAAGPGRDGPP